MASERQLAANRANARKSTGPRSASGKKRASRNALKHGLTTPVSGAEFIREIEALAGQIADDPEDRLRMVAARDAAAAQLELTRVPGTVRSADFSCKTSEDACIQLGRLVMSSVRAERTHFCLFDYRHLGFGRRHHAGRFSNLRARLKRGNVSCR